MFNFELKVDSEHQNTFEILSTMKFRYLTILFDVTKYVTYAHDKKIFSNFMTFSEYLKYTSHFKTIIRLPTLSLILVDKSPSILFHHPFDELIAKKINK